MSIPELDAIEGSILGSLIADSLLSGTSMVVGDARFNLFVAETLSRSLGRLQERLALSLVRAYSEPLGKRDYDPDVLSGCDALRASVYDGEALPVTPEARGWGAASRASSVGLLCDESMATEITALLTALTHQHPASIFSSCVWSVLVGAAGRGVAPLNWSALVESVAVEMEMPPALEAIPLREQVPPGAWWDAGRQEFLFSFSLISSQRWDEISDPALSMALEKGTTSSEAVSLACVLAQALSDSNEPYQALGKVAEVETGAEMLSQMTGSLLGATYGRTVWPGGVVRCLGKPVLGRLEYCLEALIDRRVDEAYVAPLSLTENA